MGIKGSKSSSAGALEPEDDTEELLRDYLNLTPDLTALYEQWSSSDPNFKKRAPKFTGVRMLRQDPWEALLGFICSSNNNIVRISQMVGQIALRNGYHLTYTGTQPVFALWSINWPH